MANAWREHVKKTMAKMKADAKGKTVMLKDVLKAAGKTYKKSGDSSSKKVSKKSHKKSQKKSGKKSRKTQKSARRKSRKGGLMGQAKYKCAQHEGQLQGLGPGLREQVGVKQIHKTIGPLSDDTITYYEKPIMGSGEELTCIKYTPEEFQAKYNKIKSGSGYSGGKKKSHKSRKSRRTRKRK